MEIFDKKETKYLNWLKDNTNGYVINSDRNQRSPYRMLHHATCGFIGPKNLHRTDTGYFKICFLNRNELENWATENSGQVLENCGHCM